ncbi:MAG TPA: dephospho-CoA kinase [Methylophaga aminisulfidivorans]|uniref:Dephospho-CoA kinase n=2 Tax=root TaxID=1 RepID=A0A7C1ZXT6_9GAMM|nr:dephospho-CoA kinase [Methylophaga aminisulfidivorans]HEC75470.1 dephospho-CoA kinase [Methylophaga aminisulfidivorans]
MTFKVGLTGGIASGKSAVTNLFQTLYAIDIIDADLIARELVKPGQAAYKEILGSFGEKALLPTGDLDRRYLRERIFANADQKELLESILHPRIRQQLLNDAEHSRSPYCILSIPLLVESNMLSLVDRVCVVDTAENTQLFRVQQRDNISASSAQAILDNQCSRQFRLAAADDIIDNNQSLNELQEQVEALHFRYLKLASV